MTHATITGDIRIISENGDGSDTIQQARNIYESLFALGVHPIVEIVIRTESHAAPVLDTANPTSPLLRKAGQPVTKEVDDRVTQARKELDSGIRKSLNGMRSSMVRPLLLGALKEVIATLPTGQTLTQQLWNERKPAWATEGKLLPKSFGTTWESLMASLV